MSSTKTVRPVDWPAYAAAFPDRYLRSSHFDQRVLREVAQPRPLDALDIGGGKEGTPALQQAHVRCWLLDPFIETCPTWMAANLNWETVGAYRFDVIVARGCFNYLTEPQIKMIWTLLKEDGCFLFNTFYQPKTGERRYTNSQTGSTGIERFRYCADQNLIEHELEPDGQPYLIRHTFFVYSLDQIIALLGTAGLSFEFFGPNSLCGVVRHIPPA